MGCYNGAKLNHYLHDEAGQWDTHLIEKHWKVGAKPEDNQSQGQTLHFDKPKLNSMSTAENQHTPIIAIDFDGTIVEHDFPRIGKLMPDAKRVINKWADMGWHILVWTCRNNYEPDHPEWDQAPIGAVAKFCDEQGLKITGINQQQAGLGFYLEARKIFANVYIDDRNLGGFPGWNATEAMVEKYFKLGGRTWDFYSSDLFKRSLNGDGSVEMGIKDPMPQNNPKE